MKKLTLSQQALWIAAIFLCASLPFLVRFGLTPTSQLVVSQQAAIAISTGLVSVLVVALMYCHLVTRSKGGKLIFGSCLVLSSASMYGSFEAVRIGAIAWQPLLPDQNSLTSLTLVIASLAKDVVAFGFASIGGNVVASAILQGNE